MQIVKISLLLFCAVYVAHCSKQSDPSTDDKDVDSQKRKDSIKSGGIQQASVNDEDDDEQDFPSDNESDEEDEVDEIANDDEDTDDEDAGGLDELGEKDDENDVQVSNKVADSKKKEMSAPFVSRRRRQRRRNRSYRRRRRRRRRHHSSRRRRGWDSTKSSEP